MLAAGLPYGVLQAIWTHGDLTLRDKAALALACPVVRPWKEADKTAHRAAMAALESDPLSWPRYLRQNTVRVSHWCEHEEHAPPTLPHGCAVKVIIDKPDADALRAICGWLGRAQPQQLFFITCNKRRACQTLTDEMLLACASCAELLDISWNELITDAAITKLRTCRDIGVEGTYVTMRSLRELPHLLRVDYPSRHGCWRKVPLNTVTLAWIKSMQDQKMLLKMWCD